MLICRDQMQSRTALRDLVSSVSEEEIHHAFIYTGRMVESLKSTN